MVDHRRTPSQRAYQLPGWFFILTGLLGVLALTTAGWVFVANPFASMPERPSPSASAQTTGPAVDPVPTASDGPSAGGRAGIDVLVLNATQRAGLAAGVAKTAEEAGWTVGDVDNWIYGAAVNAVYFPEGYRDEAELLAEDLDIASVRPATSGMSDDELTVLLVNAP